MPRQLGSGSISFGLVSIPVRLYTATSSHAPSFHLIHQVCGSRIRQQIFCPTCNRVVDRQELVKGFEVSKDEYVTFTPDELKALEGEASKIIDIAEFVPLSTVDPLYFEGTYYLGPDRGGDKAYRLLAEAMADAEQVALATFVIRGKENLVLIRSRDGGLVLHTMYFADEVRDFGEIDKGQRVTVKEAELQLAKRLISELAQPAFKPEKFQDAYRERVLAAAQEKAQGNVIRVIEPESPRAAVVNLMDALKASLSERKPTARVARPTVAAEPPAHARRTEIKAETRRPGKRSRRAS